ncbi:hypothetical protein AB1Y20_019644 [Prymnesium parvum]|uniref:Uncharacterized protein n=1 Tax=Prymnesium parvum TaxID=97485 RepID=A0AB34JVI5_PRYPA
MRSQAEVPAVRRAQRSGGQRTRVPHVGGFGPVLDDHLEVTEEESGYAEGSDTSSASHPCPCSRPYGVAFSSSASSLPRQLVPIPTPFEPTPREAAEAQPRNFGPPAATADAPAWQPPPPMQSAASPARRRSEPRGRGFGEVICPDSPAAVGDEERMASVAGAPVEATWHASAAGGQMDTAQHLPEVEQLALDASILAELRLLADAGRLSGERLGSFTPFPEPGSRASTDSSGLGALRLSGLDSDLKQLLRQQASAATMLLRRGRVTRLAPLP